MLQAAAHGIEGVAQATPTPLQYPEQTAWSVKAASVDSSLIDGATNDFFTETPGGGYRRPDGGGGVSLVKPAGVAGADGIRAKGQAAKCGFEANRWCGEGLFQGEALGLSEVALAHCGWETHQDRVEANGARRVPRSGSRGRRPAPKHT